MPDWTAWVQAAATIVQAATAVVIMLLTRRLAKANDALAKATDSYAKSARDQVDELVTARLATIQPRLHLTAAGHHGAPDPHFIGLVIDADLLNAGMGPAIDVVGRLEHNRLQFSMAMAPQTVPSGQSCTLSFEAQASATDAGGQAMDQAVRLVVEYRDLAGRHWTTLVPARLGFTHLAGATYESPQMSFQMLNETSELAEPSILPWLTAGDRRLQVWSADQ